jgi:hypothetical protein
MVSADGRRFAGWGKAATIVPGPHAIRRRRFGGHMVVTGFSGKEISMRQAPDFIAEL